MQTNERYFYRMQGEWTFHPIFRLLSWQEFGKSEASLLNKFRALSLLLVQAVFGPYKMKTKVEFRQTDQCVVHTTLLKKWGLTLLRSHKIIHFNPNGVDLEINGEEFYWPFTWKAIVVSNLKGFVESSATRARYQMPLFGLVSQCEAIMEDSEATIKVHLPWIEGVFKFTESSKEELKKRSVPD